MLLELPAGALDTLGESTAGLGGEAVKSIASNPGILVIGIVLIAAAFVIFFLLKKLIVNSILGFIGWILLMVFFPLGEGLAIPGLVVSVIFGLAGVGALLVLKFFGVV